MNKNKFNKQQDVKHEKDLVLLIRRGGQALIAPANRYNDEKTKANLHKQGWRIATTEEAKKYFGESNVSEVKKETPKKEVKVIEADESNE